MSLIAPCLRQNEYFRINGIHLNLPGDCQLPPLSAAIKPWPCTSKHDVKWCTKPTFSFQIERCGMGLRVVLPIYPMACYMNTIVFYWDWWYMNSVDKNQYFLAVWMMWQLNNCCLNHVICDYGLFELRDSYCTLYAMVLLQCNWMNGGWR